MNSATSRESAAAPEQAKRSRPPNAARTFGKMTLLRDRERDRSRSVPGCSPLRCFFFAASAVLNSSLNGRGCVGICFVHAGVDLVPDARHGEEDRGLHLGQVLDELRRRRRRCAVEPPVARQVELDASAEHVRPRQERERAVVALHDRRPRAARSRCCEVAVREHHALRVARRARGVDERGEVARIGNHERRGMAATDREQPFIGRRIFRVAVEVDDVTQVRQRRGASPRCVA